MNWRPSASLDAVRRRARLLERMRGYFAEQQVGEVCTPVLGAHASTEPTLRNLVLDEPGPRAYLRTSPESALKRLLAAGSGDIYEIGPVFRGDESGRLHACEFTLLEWYRVGFDHHRLMEDVAALLLACGHQARPQRLAWATLCRDLLGAVPHALTTRALAEHIGRLPIALAPADFTDRALLLDVVYAEIMTPRLAQMGTVLLYDFPPEMRAYARLSPDGEVAERFELLIDGIEIANGYHEITDAEEQRACFSAENRLRQARGLPAIDPDPLWLAALAAGMPAVAGVALGLERLQMVLDGAANIDAVTSFGASAGR